VRGAIAAACLGRIGAEPDPGVLGRRTAIGTTPPTATATARPGGQPSVGCSRRAPSPGSRPAVTRVRQQWTHTPDVNRERSKNLASPRKPVASIARLRPGSGLIRLTARLGRKRAVTTLRGPSPGDRSVMAGVPRRENSHLMVTRSAARKLVCSAGVADFESKGFERSPADSGRRAAWPIRPTRPPL
jgi:hypothetical protein